MWDYETSTAFLGTWGWYQVKVIFFLSGCNILSVISLLTIPPHQCYIPAHSNLSQDWIQASIPVQVWQEACSVRIHCRSHCLQHRFESWAVFIVCFFMVGLGQLKICIALFVMSSEILVSMRRLRFSCLGLPFFNAAGMVGTAYLVRNWRHLSFMAVSNFGYFPYWWLIPESPHWLVFKDRLKEAKFLLRTAALGNKVEFPPNSFGSANVEQPKQSRHVKPEVSGYLNLLRNMTTRNITLIVWFVWFSLNVNYFRLQFDLSTLSGNPFLNYFLMALIEFPAYFSNWLTAKTLPRRLSFTGISLLGTLALLFIKVTLYNSRDLTLFLVPLGKFAVLAAERIFPLFTGELCPTVFRNMMISSAALFSRVGFSISPCLLQLAVFYKSLLWMIVSSLSIISILACLFLPESFGKLLPDTTDQMQVIQKFK